MTMNKETVKEIVLTGTNDGGLYRQVAQPIMLQLAKKKVKGTYSSTLALKAWENLVDRTVTLYRKKFGKYNGYIPYPLDGDTKRAAAKEFMNEYSEEFNSIVAELKASAKTKSKTARRS